MDRFQKSNLEDLLGHQSEPCLSLYMPTERVGVEVRQNPIRFKNLLNEAEDRLCDYGLRRPDAKEFLERAQNELLMHETIWQHQDDGLALFVAPDLFQYYRLPITFEEMVTVDKRWYLKHLFELLQNDGRFYILALSQNQVRLLEGTKYQVKEIELEGVPSSLSDALKWDDPQKQLQQHSSNRGRRGGERGPAPMIFHGQGEGIDDEKTNLLRFFQKLDQGLNDFLAGQHIPLLLAGVEYLFPIYQEAHSYNYLIEQGIPGNPEDLSDETLHTRAWEILAPFFQKEQEEAADLYRQETGRESGLASNDIRVIIPNAYSGRVGKLFVREDNQVWGKYDRDQNQVRIHNDRNEDSEDLLNLAALYTFQNDGTVYVVKESEMPDSSTIAALFRY